jgi:hypothetical protein
MRDLERERMDSNDEASGARTSGPAAAKAPGTARPPAGAARQFKHSESGGEPVGLAGPATVTDGRKPRKPERPDIVL